ncbi:MAG: TIGR00288 family NYN domain-containing protein [Candidatus Diapherotrites archaeon]|uniref:TIGR00288 family NYN domain-containing protein n=1 Tax=Candidatus Iainarchaeum sp. TaxID=3101447 RepID=A0A8T4L3C7_9ARCH|nr:TIGR00288 family NYN domain-containing protein [Candidatus Diapherotrites archaeon]
MLEGLRQRVGGKEKEKKKAAKNIAVFVDGPNILRKELGIDLKDVKAALAPFGQIKIGKVFLNQFASEKLVEAVVNQGFESIITVGDIDVAMAVEAVEAIFNPNIGVIAFVSRDADFWPAIVKAKRYGKDTVVCLADEASAASLKNTSDFVVILKKTK